MPRTFRLYVEIDEVLPPVWRQLSVPSSISLHDLHLVLQTAFGWSGTHLYEFQVDDESYRLLDEQDSEDGDAPKGDTTTTALGELHLTKGSDFQYRYDFGDNWEHTVRVEEIAPGGQTPVAPACLDGKRSCPPEDCGGSAGYMSILRILRKPEHEEHAETVEWLGEGFDPEFFDRTAVNAALSTG